MRLFTKLSIAKVMSLYNCQVTNNRQSNGRAVGFSPDTTEETSSSLHRRDTPHHLKQSRVRSEVNGQDVSDKLRQMIAQNPALVQPMVSQRTSLPPAQASTSEEESSSEVQ